MKVMRGVAQLFRAAICSVAAGQHCRAKAFRLVIPFGAGQEADIAVRAVALKLSGNLKRPLPLHAP